jgi:hypothetical protein
MAACSVWTYKGVTPAVFKALQELGKQQGFVVPSTPTGSFSISVAGLRAGFQFSWDKRSGTLLLQCVSKPIVGCAAVKRIADQIVAQCGGMIA